MNNGVCDDNCMSWLLGSYSHADFTPDFMLISDCGSLLFAHPSIAVSQPDCLSGLNGGLEGFRAWADVKMDKHDQYGRNLYSGTKKSQIQFSTTKHIFKKICCHVWLILDFLFQILKFRKQTWNFEEIVPISGKKILGY